MKAENSLKDVAEILKMKPHQVQNIERQALKKLYRFCHVKGISLTDLVDFMSTKQAHSLIDDL